MDKRLGAILSIVITCLVSTGTICLKSCDNLNNTNTENMQIETQNNGEQ